MKNLSFALVLMAFASSVFAAPQKFECYPETGNGDEVLFVTFDYKKQVSIQVKNSKVDVCGKGRATGKFVEYGESLIKITCKKGLVVLRQDYDETSINVAALRLGLSDTTYMCN